MNALRLGESEAAELAELLELLDDWLACGDKLLDRSLLRFSAYGVGLDELRVELARFAFLLGDER